MRMLGVDIYQELPQISAVREGGRRPVYVGARSTLGGDGAAQDAVPRRLEVTLGEPHLGAGVKTHIKAGCDVRARGARADSSRVSAIADAKAQGIEHD